MTPVLSLKRVFLCTCLGILWISACACLRSAESQSKRPINAEDAIAMRSNVDAACSPRSGTTSQVGQFSADGRYVAIVLKHGNLQENVNEYTLSVLDTEKLRSEEAPRTLATIRSPAQHGIQQVCWKKDNRTILFIGTPSADDSGLFSLDISTGATRRLTPTTMQVLHYVLTNDEQGIALICDTTSQTTSANKRTNGAPFIVGDQTLVSLIQGKTEEDRPAFTVYWMGADQSIKTLWQGTDLYSSFLELSPSGRFAILCQRLRADRLLKQWQDYDYGENNTIIKPLFGRAAGSTIVPLQMYIVLDLKTGETHPLWELPRISLRFQEMKWAPDGISVFLHQIMLPHGLTSQEGRSTSAGTQADVKLSLETGKWEIASGLDWSPPSPPIHPIEMSLEQALDRPPVLVAKDSAAGKLLYALDLNPRFSELQFGTAKTIPWEVDGYRVEGGLYLPPEYSSLHRYPLVIQTHGFDEGQFSMDGREEWSSAFAARILAAQGIAVLQTHHMKDPNDLQKVEGDPRLGLTSEQRARTFAMHVYERAVEELDQQGIIDKREVGISGFSRTVWFVEYTLTHSKTPFKTTLLVDGIDGGYFSYLAFRVTEYDSDNGGKAPFGEEGIAQWSKEAPGFNLDHVQCPVRLVSFGATASLLQHWEWFSGLRLLQKPVELAIFPTEDHVLIQPKERYSAMTDMVKWFTFWLQDGQNSLTDISPQWIVMKAAVRHQ